jgi:hypothetical protein
MYDAMFIRIQEDEHLVGDDIAPYQVLDIDDFELLEESLRGPMNLAEMLEKKTVDPMSRWEGFMSYLNRVKYPDFVPSKSSRLQARFREISSRASDLLIGRSR